MIHKQAETESYRSELRLIIEEFCSDILRHIHIRAGEGDIDTLLVDRGVDIGHPDVFANLRVQPPGKAPYFVEVKHGYPAERLVQLMREKYHQPTPQTAEAAKVLLLVDCASHADWPAVEKRVREALRPGLALEVWDEQKLIDELESKFGVRAPDLRQETLLVVREQIDRAKGFAAFGGRSLAEYEDTPLKSLLVWHFGSWNLRRIRGEKRMEPRDILPPGVYRDVIVLVADLCAFSSYVRDTRDEGIIRHGLTTFYSMSRAQVIWDGGMFYQFVGDEIIGLFGLPDQRPGLAGRALRSAKALLTIGRTVSSQWQRHIDHLEEKGGLHVGIATGDVQIVPVRPFSRLHMGAIGDPINLAARLLENAGPGEIVVSNSFFNELSADQQREFQEIGGLQARNVGKIKAWKRPAPLRKPDGK